MRSVDSTAKPSSISLPQTTVVVTGHAPTWHDKDKVSSTATNRGNEGLSSDRDRLLYNHVLQREDEKTDRQTDAIVRTKRIAESGPR